MRGLPFTTHSAEETVQVGKTLAPLLPKKGVVCLIGELGSGKTTLIKGIISELTHFEEAAIQSPTFTYLHPYQGKERTLYHFDLYRMNHEREFLLRGLDEYFHFNALCCIEWPEKIASLLPKKLIRIAIEYESKNSRSITWDERETL